jgi:predicted Fe-Mo cluster-binding NifX family protein
MVLYKIVAKFVLMHDIIGGKMMKICITSQDSHLDSKLETRFGRSPYFVIYNTETSDVESFRNPNVSGASGAGIQSAQFIADKGVNVLLTHQVGPKASQVLKAAGIDVVNFTGGTVREVIDKYLADSSRMSGKPMGSPRSIGVLQERSVETSNWFNRCFRKWFGMGFG